MNMNRRPNHYTFESGFNIGTMPSVDRKSQLERRQTITGISGSQRDKVPYRAPHTNGFSPTFRPPPLPKISEGTIFQTREEARQRISGQGSESIYTSPTTTFHDSLPRRRVSLEQGYGSLNKETTVHHGDDTTFGDIRDRCILRLREHNAKTPTPLESGGAPGIQSPPTQGGPPPQIHAAPPQIGARAPTQFEDELQYYSESELDMADVRGVGRGFYPPSTTRNRGYPNQTSPGMGVGVGPRGVYYPTRPASALPPGATAPPRGYAGYGSIGHGVGARQYGGRLSAGSDTEASGGHMSRPFARMPYPERDDSIGRSGSATPVIDEEARLRMMGMEKQLANLSSLVHSALSAKHTPSGGSNVASHMSEANATLQRDYEALRREILGGSKVQGSALSSEVDAASEVDRQSEMSFHSVQSDLQHATTARTTSPALRRQLYDVKHRVGDVQAELKHVKRLAQMNSQASKELLRETYEKIKQLLESNRQSTANSNITAAIKSQLDLEAPLAPHATDEEFWRKRALADQEADRHRAAMRRLDGALGDLESDVESLRLAVVNTNRKLRVTEVEGFTNQLASIGRLAAHLKTQFPALHTHMKAVMSAEMEKVVKDERFLKEEPVKMDVVLKRCKKMTNTMMTMKKLAMVQDQEMIRGTSASGARQLPQSALRRRSQDDLREPLGSSRGPAPAPPVPPPPTGYRGPQPPPKPAPPGMQARAKPRSASVTPHSTSTPYTPNPYPLTSSQYATSGQTQQPSDTNLLDSLLVELQTVGASPSPGGGSAEKQTHGSHTQRMGFPPVGQPSQNQRETTPSSVSSEPIGGDKMEGQQPKVPPPPMNSAACQPHPRYATMDRQVRSTTSTTSHQSTTNQAPLKLPHDLAELKAQLMGPLPHPMERTNALEDEPIINNHGYATSTHENPTATGGGKGRPPWVTSEAYNDPQGGSSESVNSQDGQAVAQARAAVAAVAERAQRNGF